MASLDLRGCVIVADQDRASFVDQAVMDLADYTGSRVNDTLGSPAKGTVVLVGKDVVRGAAASRAELSGIGLDGLSDQGFVLKTVRAGGADFVLCSGGGPRGDAYAVIELIKAIDRNGDRIVIDEMDRREEPFFVRRGMYAHQHWAYAYPYALRSWKFEDWRQYIDLLAYMKINLFQIWSMAAILPSPLSDGDREYLENYHKVIDYAKNRRGMEVFIGECANNTADTDGGKPIQEREYFDVEVLKDPYDPKQFQDIMDNRRNLYTVADNADGYWIIDSDPGGFKGSPPSEFVDILIGNRELLDECTLKGKDARLVYWMWQGWGKGIAIAERTEMGICRTIVEDMRDCVKEPWGLLTCWPNHLDASLDMGYIDKSILFPYGVIESEPSPPTTRLRFDEMYAQLNDAVSRYGIRHAMGNAQSPLVQLPNMFFFAECAWNGVPASLPDDRCVVSDLARLMAPDRAHELIEGWLALKELSADLVFTAAAKLEKTASERAVGRAGPLGRFYHTGLERLMWDLALQLVAHGRALVLCEALAEFAPEPDTKKAMLDYYRAALDWQAVHKFNSRHLYGPDPGEIGGLWKEYRARTGADWADELRSRLVQDGYEQSVVDGRLALISPG